jgi:hypothetical protein
MNTGSLQSVANYKTLLGQILERRPSGTRQRLAAVLAKNRSFISQITNPAYATPVPASHLDAIFEVCHFSPAERRQFLEAYALAHPKRLPAKQGTKAGTQLGGVTLPDLGDDASNKKLQALVQDFVRHMVALIEQEPAKWRRP